MRSRGTISVYDEAWEYPEDALVDDSYRPETPPQMIPRSKQPTSQPQKPQPEAKPVPVREREPAQEPVQESKPLDPEESAVLVREQEAVREVSRNAGRVIERPRSVIEMLFPSRDKNLSSQISEPSQTSESSAAPTAAAASESAPQGASATSIGVASVISVGHKPTQDPQSSELIAGAGHLHHDTEDESVAMDDRHEIRQVQGDVLGGQPVAAILINLAALAIMVGGAFLLLRLR
ncbi:hypothetical protein [Corynebacterium belfantii]|uniref:hypothetical protein n=1 Tax=Corynebacterium belfantii TaxID=2014537 RepID=UPI0035A9A95B